ncbi:hypothetical protein I4U23_025578 [Adineta vaga]|nr:hypothetical protein I4U23_025578 [Adineta vaga]
MTNKVERRLLRDDLVDDIVDQQQPVSHSNKSSYFIDSTKKTQNRPYSSFPYAFNKPKCDQDDRLQLSSTSSSRIHPSSMLMSNDERRKEIDRIIQHLYNGKLLTTTTSDEFSSSETSDPPIRMFNQPPTNSNVIVVPAVKVDDEKKINEFPPLDADVTLLQRELKEKELDITHLHKEIQELQLENKLFKVNGSASVYSTNNNESEVLRREKEILKDELSSSQELIAKVQQQQQNLIISRANRFDEINLQQKEVFEKQLKLFEKQIRILVNENDKLKQNSHQTNHIILQLKRENEDLQQKITEAKKRNDELFYQEFHSLRNNIKTLKERNNELFQENLRLQQGQSNNNWRSTIHDQQQIPSARTRKPSNSDSKHVKLMVDENSYMSEGSDSTNYLTTVSTDHYNCRPTSSTHRSATIDGNNHHRTTRYNILLGREETNTNINSVPLSKSLDQQLNFRSPRSKRIVDWNVQNHQINEGLYHRDKTIYNDEHPTRDDIESSAQIFQSCFGTHRNTITINESQLHSRGSINNHTNNSMNGNDLSIFQVFLSNQVDLDRVQLRVNTVTVSPKRPYAPLSIGDIHVGDVIKFSRQGGKVSKGSVKYIGSLPGKNDQYLGLELDEEESKHDGVYQDQRIFQCKSNKGVFIGFNKVIMAWSEQ